MAKLPSIPASLERLLGGRTMQPVVVGESGARVLRCTGEGRSTLMLKIARRNESEPLSDEVVRLRWMGMHGLAVPDVIAHEIWEDREYLVEAELPGRDASALCGVEPGSAIVAALADGLRTLHATPTADCPFQHDVASRIDLAKARVRAGQVDELDFDAERRGRTAEELMVELEAKRPTSEEISFTHGDYCLPNVILRESTTRARSERHVLVLSGFVDCARAGVADPYQDLALVARSIARSLGVRWVLPFFERYGVPSPNEKKMRFYTLLDEFF